MQVATQVYYNKTVIPVMYACPSERIEKVLSLAQYYSITRDLDQPNNSNIVINVKI